jgi:N-methylhydantoinase A
VLGYIDPDNFLGGEMRLDREAAVAACARLGARLGSDALKTAWGIWEIAKVEMVRALRAQFAQKGLDPREFAIVSMGGCGGLFNALIAQELGVRRVLVPELTSVLSAFGAANADIRRERVRSIGMLLPAPPRELAAIATELAAAVGADLAADGIEAEARSISFEADMRFQRQQFELTVGCEGFDSDAQQALKQAFEGEYQRRYGQGALVLHAAVELVSLRAIGRGRTIRAQLLRSDDLCTGEAAARRPVRAGRRRIWVADGADIQAREVDVISVRDLKPGQVIEGPALLDGTDTTIWIPGRVSARCSEHRTIDMQVLS